MKDNDHYKLYVDVQVLFTGSGKMLPQEITLPDGRHYWIDKLLDCRRAASTKAGGKGIRYTCRILGKESYLWYEENYKWFVESKVPIQFEEVSA